MPSGQPNNNFSLSEQTEPPPNVMGHTEPGLSWYFLSTITIAVIFAALLILSFKMPRFSKHRLKIIIVLITTAVLSALLPMYTEKGVSISSGPGKIVAGPPVEAPNVSGKIHGVWATMPLADKVVRDGEWMREVGINTLTFNPTMFHDEIGNITEDKNAEEEAKYTINVIHKAGMRVMLEPAALLSGSSPEVEQGEVFMKQMEKISVKYAKIAEEYNVEYYSPLAEPVNHLGPVNAEKFMQGVLPKIRKVYNGTVVFKKTEIDISTLLEWEQDTSIELDFLLTEGGSYLSIDVLSDKVRKVFSQVNPNHYSGGGYSDGKGRGTMEKNIDVQTGSWNKIRVDIRDDKISTYVNNQLINEYKDTSAKRRAYVLSGMGFRARNLKIMDVKNKIIYQDNFQFSNKWNIKEGDWVVKDGEMHGINKGNAEMIYDIDFSGYDILAINMLREGTDMTDQEYRDYVRHLIRRTKEQAEDDGVPVVILGEFGGTNLPEKDWGKEDRDASAPLTNWQVARTAKMVLEEAEDTTQGYYYFGWDLEGQGIAVIPEVEKVIKDWYNNH